MDLIIVVAIVGILLAMFVVNLPKIRAGFDLRNAASLTVSEVRRAQAAAIAEGTKYTVEFVLVGKPRLNTYKADDYSCDEPDCWEPVPRPASGADWPPTVTIAAATSNSLPDCGDPLPGSSTNKCLTFAFLGAPETAGEVLLKSETGGITRIVIEPATGRVSEQQ